MAGKAKLKPDISSLGGLVLAAVGIVGGLLLEGGELRDITQVTAAIIVLGGTLGAVMITTPMHVLMGAAGRLKEVFFESPLAMQAVVEQLVDFATKARKGGIVALEREVDMVSDPFFKKAVTLAVDGTDIQELRKMLEIDMAVEEHHGEAEAKVFENAGGYSPTIGIIGAVMGLIQVMKNLSDIDKVGHGIAVSFVATVYGVAVANVFFLPAANKIKARIQQHTEMKEAILEGMVGIVEGLNPKIIQSKLDAFVPKHPKGKAKK
ncbi:MAG: flagellar motor protein [Bryobacteraceae bacterium]